MFRDLRTGPACFRGCVLRGCDGIHFVGSVITTILVPASNGKNIAVPTPDPFSLFPAANRWETEMSTGEPGVEIAAVRYQHF